MNHPSYHSDVRGDFPDTFVSAAEASSPDSSDAAAPAVPVIPLPNPGEGGPVYDPSTDSSGSSQPVTPVIPLPNPGEGGPVYPGPGNGSGSGSSGGNGGNSSGGSGSGGNGSGGHSHHFHPPVFRPEFPGTNSGSRSGSAPVVIPGVTFPCFNCTATSFGRVRILNASNGYQPFYAYLGNWLIASSLSNGDITSYVQAAAGTQSITISGANGYVYIQKSIQVKASASMTVAIINTASGLDLLEISDISCNAPSGTSCLRTCNLSLNLGPFDVSTESQNTSYNVFSGVRYKEVTPYSSFYPGWYQIYIFRSGTYPSKTAATTAVNLSANTSCTLYLFNAPTAAEGLRTLAVTN